MLGRLGGIGLLIGGCVLVVGLIGGMFAAPAPTALAVQVPVPVATQLPSVPEDSKPTNPVVEPGKVHWHATAAEAFVAAKASKKPVLVFHMMGQLDHQFC